VNLRFNKKKILVIFSALCFLFLFFSFLVPSLKPALLNTLKQPFGIITLIRREFSALVFFHHNYTENERLRIEAGFLNNKLNALREVSFENTRLHKLLSFKTNSPLKVIAARVIGRSADSWSKGIIIDKGGSSGIKRSMVAITYLGLVGRVTEVTESTSKISLISDPNLGVSALVQRSRQEGLVCGTLGTYLIMKYLPLESDIKINDVIITSGLNETYPKGLVIGVVVDIRGEFSGLSRYVVIRPAVNLSNVEEVLIIVSS